MEVIREQVRSNVYIRLLEMRARHGLKNPWLDDNAMFRPIMFSVIPFLRMSAGYEFELKIMKHKFGSLVGSELSTLLHRQSHYKLAANTFTHMVQKSSINVVVINQAVRAAINEVL